MDVMRLWSGASDGRARFGPILEKQLVTENVRAGFKAGHEARAALLVGDDGAENETFDHGPKTGNAGDESSPSALEIARDYAKLGPPTYG